MPDDTGCSVQVDARSVADHLDRVIAHCQHRAGGGSPAQARAPCAHTQSLTNLLHYLALREQDHRELQKTLAELGLSSLGRCEPAVLRNLAMVRHAAGRLIDPPRTPPEPEPIGISLARGRTILDQRTDALLGPRPHARAVRIMVTMPTEAAQPGGDERIARLLRAGMNAARINTAHDNPADWRAIIRTIRAQDPEHRCRIFMDLAGPKIRTTALRKHAEPRDRVRLAVADRCCIRTTTPPPVLDTPDTLENPAMGTEIWTETPELLRNLRPGHAVWFDDGKIGCRVLETHADRVDLEVTDAKPGGQRLRTGRGLNLPDTPIDRPALTQDDTCALREFAADVDAFCLSFVNRPEDVRELAARINDAAPPHQRPGIVLKIETRRGFERLAELLVALLEVERGAVMIARGDLAVEVGFARLAEVQEEILWLCEAAHIPVIWATEVLASLAKRGLPVRGEVTDAAMGQRAECVMLNKGPRILEAVSALSDILSRMELHQRKKMSTLRPLRIARPLNMHAP